MTVEVMSVYLFDRGRLSEAAILPGASLFPQMSEFPKGNISSIPRV